MTNKEMEAAQKLINSIHNDPDRLKGSTIERIINRANAHEEYKDLPNIHLGHLMEFAGISLSTPIVKFINNPVNGYLLAADFANVIKQRFTSPTIRQLRETTRIEGGILPRTVGTLHRPSLIDLCGGRSITIAPSSMSRDGAIGKWRPFDSESLESFITSEYSEIGTIFAHFMETERGAMFKYAFGLKVDRKMTRDSISVDYVGKFLEGVFLHVEGEMFDHLYDRVQDSVNPITTESLDAVPDTFSSRYLMNEEAWRKLHEQYDKNHAMTDVFTDSVQHQVALDLKLREGATITIDRNATFF